MDKPADHGGGDANNPFCLYCTDDKGNLLPKDQVRAKMIQFYIQKQGKTQEEAEKLTDQLMGTMPAWKGEGVGAAAPSEPTTPPTTEPEEKPTPTEPSVPPASEPTQEPTPTPEPPPKPTTTEEPPPTQPTGTPTEPVKPEGEAPTE